MYQGYHVERTSLLNFLEISTILENFPPETSNIITQQVVLSLKGYGCSCLTSTMITSKVSNAHGIFYNREIGKEIDKEKEKKDYTTQNSTCNSVIKPLSVSLKSSQDVAWVLEVMKYAITIPVFNNLEVVKHTVHVYSAWLQKTMGISEHLSTSLNKEISETSDITDQIPACIKHNANDYAPLFLSSLCNFFKNFVNSYHQFASTAGGGGASASGGAGGTGGGGSGTGSVLLSATVTNTNQEQKMEYSFLVKEVAVLIETILSTVEKIAINSKKVTDIIWDSLLYFCLNVGNFMLSCPSEPTHLTFTLADRISSMIFRVWLQACSKYFPRPSLWKTFSKLCQSWRHQEAFINQWNKINAAFTNRLLGLIHKNSPFPGISDVDPVTNEMIPNDLTDSSINDCWYRFLNIIGNPVDICQSKMVLNFDFLDSKSKRRSFSQAALNNAVNNLPNIFRRAMHGISNIVDAFLGYEHPGSGFVINDSTSNISVSPPQSQKPPLTNIEQASPPEVRKPVVSHPIFNIRKGKPSNINSRILTLTFDPNNETIASSINELRVEAIPDPHPCRPEANSMLRLFGNWLFEASIVGVKQNMENPAISVRASNVEISKFNAGRAEACGALCRIFTHCHRNNLSMDYLTKFYIVLFYGLDIEPPTASSLVLSSILFNTTDLLRIGLVGVNILVPRLFRGVEFVLTNDIEKPDLLSKNQLRRAAIHHLLSMISLPSYFIGIDIKPLLPSINVEKRDTFLEIRKNMSTLLSENIRNESDPLNLQMLMSCLVALLESMVKEELLDQTNVLKSSTDTSPVERIDHGSDIFNHALGLLSINLVHRWKDDLQILQFSLETLNDMSSMKFKNIDQKICKRAIRFLCEFIENQMKRKQKEHVRLLHNVIISAYYCLALWLVNHSNLLDDRECLSSVLEISELGISGSKSKTHSNGSENVRLKNSKSSSPSSKRVQVAAEFLLHAIMSELGAYPGLVGVESTSSLAKEELFLREMLSSPTDENKYSFRYFGLDNDIIFALLEKPLNKLVNPNDPLPTLSVIIRTCFGRYVWEMRLRQLPASYDVIDSNNNISYPDCFNGTTVLLDKLVRSRPFNTGIYKHMSDFQNDIDFIDNDSEPTHFPDIVNRVEPFKVEFSIPKLESLLDEFEKQKIESAIVENLKSINAFRSTSIKNRLFRSKNNIGDLQCKKPTPVTEFQTARLLLYHMGYLGVNTYLSDNNYDTFNFIVDPESRLAFNRAAENIDGPASNFSGKNNNNVLTPSSSLLPNFSPLESTSPNFFSAIDGLDKLPSRSNDTCLIYYVKAGQTDPMEIISNYNDWPYFNVDFLAILLSFGWMVDVADHPGWTGNIETSFQVNHYCSTNATNSSLNRGSFKFRNKYTPSIPINNMHGGTNNTIPKELHRLIQGPVPDGSACIIYWADLLKEVVFLMASNENLAANKMDFCLSVVENSVTPTGGFTSKQDFGNSQQPKTAIPEKGRESGSAVSIIWVEKWLDIESINIISLIGKDKSAILICPTSEGLFRIKVYRPPGKYFCAGPLFSGMILDIKNVGSLVRQTVVNINSRIRQDSESCYASHVQRSQKLQHIISEHRLQLHSSTVPLPDLFTSLLYPSVGCAAGAGGTTT